MSKFPVDAPLGKVLKTLQTLGFETVRAGAHIAMRRKNPDGTETPLTLPNHPHLKSSTLKTICAQSGIKREDFLTAYLQA